MATLTTPLISAFLLVALLGGGGAGVGTLRAAPETWAPVGGAIPAGGFVVDRQSRMESLAFYNAVFLASEGAEYRIGWTGSYGANCDPGDTAPAFKEDVRRRINYYRALSGLPATITFDAEFAPNDGPVGSPRVEGGTTKRAACQASANLNALSNVFFDRFALVHNPTEGGSICYSNTAWNGSWHSNLTIGYFGPKAIDVYMADDDLNDDQSNNINVGHRRWLLYSRARDMASGDVPRSIYTDDSGTYNVLPASSLYVIGAFAPVATAPKQVVTWPPSGYVPLPLKPLRWSISYPDAIFSGANSAITLKGPSGQFIPVNVLSYTQTNLGDNTLVFQPQEPPLSSLADITYTATVTGISGNGAPVSHTWQTTFFDPNDIGLTQTVSGPAQPSASASDYKFNAAPLAGAYQVLINSPSSNTTYVENGEGNAPDIVVEKTGSYPVIQGPDSLDGISFTPYSGSKSLHLCFPLDSSEVDYLPHDQSFSLGPEFIPTPTSILSFKELFRWLFNGNRLSVEISTDGGSRWAELYGRNGAYNYAAGSSYDSNAWDAAWQTRGVSLAAWAGRPVLLRFILRPGYVSFDGPDINHGCYLDDISLSNVSRLSTGNNITIASTAFKLDKVSVGRPLIPGSSYLIRVRSQIGNRYMGYSNALTVVAAPLSGFETTWPALASNPAGDGDQDGISNLIEYAFGLNPTSNTSAAALPQPSRTAAGLTFSFSVPPDRSDLIYTAECTSNFVIWASVSNQGTPASPIFTVPFGNHQNCFMRLRVSQRTAP